MEKHTILVIGGAGYIGSACVKALLDRGHTVAVLDNLSHGDRAYVDTRAEFLEGDVRDKNILSDACRRHQFDTVLHFAALKAAGASEKDPMLYFSHNIGATLNVLEAMCTHHIPNLIFSSSALVYKPMQPATAFSEDAPTDPSNVYGRAKLIDEMVIRDLLRTSKLARAVIFRFFNVVGDAGLEYVDHKPENAFPLLAEAVTRHTPFKIFGSDYATPDGTAVRDYVHLSDVVAAYVQAVESDVSGTYNLGTNTGTSVLELVKEFEKAANAAVPTIPSPRREGDPDMLVADAGKARRELGWEPKHTIADAVRSTLAAYGRKDATTG